MVERTHLPGGSGGVWYADDPVLGPVVHRPVGPWTPAVHSLLAFLAEDGLEGVPRVLAVTDTEETLTFLRGEALDPGIREADDDVLAQGAAWLRRYHDAVRGWDPGDVVWRQTSSRLAPGQLICHNDTGSYNWIIDGGRFAGLIDWDQAGPGHPIDDVAILCWSAIPLGDAVPPADAARRVRIVAEAYGAPTPNEILDAVATRMLTSVTRITAGIERGDPGMLSLRDRGEPENTRRAVDGYLARLPAIRAALG